MYKPLSSSQKIQLTIDEAYAQALEHTKSGNYTEAAKLCSAIKQTAPTHISGINLLGIIAQKVDRHDLAIKHFSRCIEIDDSRALLYFNLARSLDKLARREEAIKALETAIEKEPENSKVREYLEAILKNPNTDSEDEIKQGLEFHKSAQLDRAIECYKTALEIQPENIVALINMGAALQALNRLDRAVTCYRKAIAINTSIALPHYNLGNALQEQGELDAAVKSYQKAIALKTDYAESYGNLANTLEKLGKFDKAVENYQKALAIKPDYAEAHFNLGNTFKKQLKLDEAVKSYQKALAIKPNFAEAHCNLGNTMQEQERLEAAISCYQKALTIKPNYGSAHSNFANALSKQGKIEAALAHHKKAITINPDSAEAFSNYGSYLLDQARFSEASEILQKAIALDAEHVRTQYNMGFVNLALGKLSEGWRCNEFRYFVKPEEHNYFTAPRWEKEPLAGKTILVYAEQGLGDELYFSMLFPKLARLAKLCIVLCDPRLERLFSRSFANIKIIGINRANYSTMQNLPPFDYQVAAGSLYGLLQPGMDREKPYLLADPLRVEYWQKYFTNLGPEPKIGISWTTSNRTIKRMTSHSRLEQWGPVLDNPNCTFINLYYGECQEEVSLARSAFKSKIVDFPKEEIDLKNDLDDVVAMMASLDLIICTPGTAGALSYGAGCRTIFLYGKTTKWLELGKNTVYHHPDYRSIYFADEEEFALAINQASMWVKKIADSSG
ncbi:MAG: tetratricopeptide repeat protein [Magnetococcales bacterium]|nr:tetratricopeptide repeat protein [Magnetococcales bacterium]